VTKNGVMIYNKRKSGSKIVTPAEDSQSKNNVKRIKRDFGSATPGLDGGGCDRRSGRGCGDFTIRPSRGRNGLEANLLFRVFLVSQLTSAGAGGVDWALPPSRVQASNVFTEAGNSVGSAIVVQI